MNGEDRVAFSAERDFKFWGNRLSNQITYRYKVYVVF